MTPTSTFVWTLSLAATCALGCASPLRGEVRGDVRAEVRVASESPLDQSALDGASAEQRIARALPTGVEATSTVVLARVAPRRVELGQSFTYELSVRNLTRAALAQVVIHDTLPSGFELTETEPAFDDAARARGEWTLGELEPLATKRVRVTGSAAAVGVLESCAEVSYRTGLSLTTVVVHPRLSLTASAPAELLSCDELPLSLRVTNDGTGPATGVIVSVALPSGLRDPQDPAGDAPRRVLGSLAPGESRALVLVLRAARPGTYVATADARGAGGVEARTVQVQTRVREARLALRLSAPETGYLGRLLRYRLSVANAGDGAARAAVLEVGTPAHASFASASEPGELRDDHIVWHLGELAPGEERVLEATFRAETEGLAIGRAELRAECAGEPVRARVETRLDGVPAILLEVADRADPVVVGEDATYLITVTNQGSASATRVRIVCRLPAGCELVLARGATRAASLGGVVSYGELAALEPGARATFEVTLRSSVACDARFRVELTSNELGDPVGESEATTFYE